MKTPAGYLNVRQAAAFVGYEPLPERNDQGKRNTSRSDLGVRNFYAWAARHGVQKHYRGRCLLFKRTELEAAIEQSTEARQDKFARMTTLARRHAAGEDLHA